MVYRGLYSYRQRVRVITLFPNTFSYCFCKLSGDFGKVFERKVWRVQVAHLHNAACAFSSPSGCFQLSTNLDKDFCRYLFIIVVKNKSNVFSVALVKFHWFEINWHVFMQKLSFVYYYSENRATSRIWKVLSNMVFPPIWGGKMAAFWACTCKLSWTLFSPARIQPLYGAGRKESSGTGLGSSQSLWDRAI